MQADLFRHKIEKFKKLIQEEVKYDHWKDHTGKVALEKVNKWFKEVFEPQEQ